MLVKRSTKINKCKIILLIRCLLWANTDLNYLHVSIQSIFTMSLLSDTSFYSHFTEEESESEKVHNSLRSLYLSVVKTGLKAKKSALETFTFTLNNFVWILPPKIKKAGEGRERTLAQLPLHFHILGLFQNIL